MRKLAVLTMILGLITQAFAPCAFAESGAVREAIQETAQARQAERVELSRRINDTEIQLNDLENELMQAEAHPNKSGIWLKRAGFVVIAVSVLGLIYVFGQVKNTAPIAAELGQDLTLKGASGLAVALATVGWGTTKAFIFLSHDQVKELKTKIRETKRELRILKNQLKKVN